ncbi:hypothetical protein DSO57_1002348 [Entomophthora muscae]|uniref:Uncharacterized protein n=1 Tax=Entomophthora muscae TaxID=34485 RepID=A0ACC2UUE0_9FUNG|nr:hypothetical protein DSO57_1002348 [Entomophthora muscae]
MQMLCSSQVRFLNQLLPVSSCQLRAQDCNTTVAGSERGTATHVEGEEEVGSIFAETEAPLIDFLALALRIYKIGPTISTSKLLPPCLQHPLRYFALVATPKSCPPPTLSSSIDLG